MAVIDKLRECFADAMVREARNLEWRPGTMVNETPLTDWGLRRAVLEHDTFPNDVLRFRLPREHEFYFCPTTGDGNCLYTSVSAGMAMVSLRAEIERSGGWFRLSERSPEPEQWHLRPDPTDRSHILRGYDLRLDVVEYFLRGYEDPLLAERATTLEAIASQCEPPGQIHPPPSPCASDCAQASESIEDEAHVAPFQDALL
jgi:hypothetical protein